MDNTFSMGGADNSTVLRECNDRIAYFIPTVLSKEINLQRYPVLAQLFDSIVLGSPICIVQYGCGRGNRRISHVIAILKSLRIGNDI